MTPILPAAKRRRLLSRPPKSLKKLFIERRIPRAEREHTAVLTDGEQVLAVVGIGMDPRFLPAEGEPAAIIQISFS